jgi:hypothetical protein
VPPGQHGIPPMSAPLPAVRREGQAAVADRAAQQRSATRLPKRQRHTPFTQKLPTGQPQKLPQQVVVLGQHLGLLPQRLAPDGEHATHTPETHVSVDEQQSPPHARVPLGQTHVPVDEHTLGDVQPQRSPQQVEPLGQQFVPQAVGAVVGQTQVMPLPPAKPHTLGDGQQIGPQSVVPVGQTHVPVDEHTLPGGQPQRLPQQVEPLGQHAVPQAFGAVVGQTHAPPEHTLGNGQPQRSPQQVVLLGQQVVLLPQRLAPDVQLTHVLVLVLHVCVDEQQLLPQVSVPLGHVLVAVHRPETQSSPGAQQIPLSQQA